MHFAAQSDKVRMYHLPLLSLSSVLMDFERVKLPKTLVASIMQSMLSTNNSFIKAENIKSPDVEFGIYLIKFLSAKRD